MKLNNLKEVIRAYTISILFALKPFDCRWNFLHTTHWNFISVFFVCFFPVSLNLVTAGLEYLPKLPKPLAFPLLLALILEPYESGLGCPFFAWKTLLSVCFLQCGQYILLALGNFMVSLEKGVI